MIEVNAFAPQLHRGIEMSAQPAPTSPRENRLLAALAAADYDRIGPHLEPAPMALGKVLYEPGIRMPG